MTDQNSLLNKLTSEFGDVVSVEDVIAVDGVSPQHTAVPQTEEAAHELVRWCGQNDVAFIPVGGATKLHIGARPSRCDLLISTHRLTSVIEHDDGNATVQAQAGITLDALDEAVGARQQFVPLDWESGSAATLGGVVATNYSGATKLRYGAPRDLVVGLHASLSDGRKVKAGSKVVKNVSGYDLNKLFIGSFGTLGLITQVTIRLRPQDARRDSWQQAYSSWSEAEHAAQQIFNGLYEPALLQIISQGDKFVLRARFDGGEAAVSAQLEKLPASHANVSVGTVAPRALELRSIMPITRAGAWAQTAKQAGADQVWWDYGLGSVQAQFEQVPGNVVDIVDDLRAYATQLEGSVVVERVPHELKSADLVWGAPRSDFALMKLLKNSFDAANVCAPGRFIGGL
jgi:glycolate oxidase FAD binding subunit